MSAGKVSDTQTQSMSRLHETLSAFLDPSVISLLHWLPVTLITAFQARARRAVYLGYILSVTQALPSQDVCLFLVDHLFPVHFSHLSNVFLSPGP